MTKVKKLKVYYGYTGSTIQRPYIRLCGKYLSAEGFQVGDKIQVLLKNETILIKKIKDN